jgi:hypothetical protein
MEHESNLVASGRGCQRFDGDLSRAFPLHIMPHASRPLRLVQLFPAEKTGAFVARFNAPVAKDREAMPGDTAGEFRERYGTGSGSDLVDFRERYGTGSGSDLVDFRERYGTGSGSDLVDSEVVV